MTSPSSSCSSRTRASSGCSPGSIFPPGCMNAEVPRLRTSSSCWCSFSSTAAAMWRVVVNVWTPLVGGTFWSRCRESLDRAGDWRWECTSLSQVASVASRGGRFCALFFDAHGEGRRIACVTYCPVNKNCHQTAAITSHNRSSLAAS